MQQGGEGWDGTDLNWLNPEQKEMLEKAQADQESAAFDMAKAVAKTFNTAHGKRVLKVFQEMQTSGRMFDPEDTDFYLAAAKGFFRSGSNAFVQWVHMMIQAAEAGPPSKKGK